MTLLDAYPLVTTPDLAAVRGFWTAHFEAAVVFDSSWFLMLGVPGAGGRSTGNGPSAIRGARRWNCGAIRCAA